MQVLYQLSYGPIDVASVACHLLSLHPRGSGPSRRRAGASGGRPASAGPSDLAPDRHQAALDGDLIGGQQDGRVGGVGGFQAHRFALAVEVLEGGAAARHQRADDRAVPQAAGIRHRLQEHHIPIGDMGLHHGVAIDREGEEATGLQQGGEIEALARVLEGFDQAAGGHRPEHRNARRRPATEELQRAGLTLLPGDPPLLLQMAQPALDRRGRAQAHGLHHLPDGGAVATRADVVVQPVVELLLGRGEGIGHRNRSGLVQVYRQRGVIVQGRGSEAAQQRGEQSLLDMQTILGLIEHLAGRPLDDARADLLPPMGRQAMEHDRAAVRLGEQGLIQAPAAEGLLPAALLLLLAHGGPNIGVERVGTAHGGERLGGEGDGGAVARQGPGPLHHPRVGLEARRRPAR